MQHAAVTEGEMLPVLLISETMATWSHGIIAVVKQNLLTLVTAVQVLFDMALRIYIVKLLLPDSDSEALQIRNCHCG